MLRSKSKKNAPGMIDSRSSMLHTPVKWVLMCSQMCWPPAPPPPLLRSGSKSPFLPDPFYALCKIFLLMVCSEAPRDLTVIETSICAVILQITKNFAHTTLLMDPSPQACEGENNISVTVLQVKNAGIFEAKYFGEGTRCGSRT